jgi:hypothetical protein
VIIFNNDLLDQAWNRVLPCNDIVPVIVIESALLIDKFNLGKKRSQDMGIIWVMQVLLLVGVGNLQVVK